MTCTVTHLTTDLTSLSELLSEDAKHRVEFRSRAHRGVASAVTNRGVAAMAAVVERCAFERHSDRRLCVPVALQVRQGDEGVEGVTRRLEDHVVWVRDLDDDTRATGEVFAEVISTVAPRATCQRVRSSPGASILPSVTEVSMSAGVGAVMRFLTVLSSRRLACCAFPSRARPR